MKLLILMEGNILRGYLTSYETRSNFVSLVMYFNLQNMYLLSDAFALIRVELYIILSINS